MSAAEVEVWCPARGIPPRILSFAMIFCLLAVALLGTVAESIGLPALGRALALSASSGVGPATVIAVWSIGVVAPLALILAALGATERRIGLGPSGIQLVSRFRKRRLRWDQLWPNYARPPQKWILVCYRRDGRSGLRFFWASKEQARALALHPKAPFNLFTPELRDWLVASGA